jgi:hypothetical protein
MVDVVLDDDDDDKAKILNNATAPSCDKSCLCARVNIPGYIDKGAEIASYLYALQLDQDALRKGTTRVRR